MSDLGSQAGSGLVTTWMADHVGIPGAVGRKSKQTNQPQFPLKPKPNPEEGLTHFNSIKAERSEKGAEEKFEASSLVHEV